MHGELTADILNGLTRAGLGRRELGDTVCPGLRVRVTVAGEVTLCFLYRFGGKRWRMILGRYPSLSLEAARTEVSECRVLLRRGVDPRSLADRPRRLQPVPQPLAVLATARDLAPAVVYTQCAPLVPARATFGDMCDAYLEHQVTVLRRSTFKEYRRKIHSFLKPTFGDRHPETMSADELQAWEDELAKRKPVDANRTHSLMAQIFKVGVRRHLTLWNPYSMIERPAPHAERARDRVLEDDEIVEIFKALRDERPVIAGFWEVLFWTALRWGSASISAWSQVKLNIRDWDFPVTKKARGNPEGTGKPFLLPLTEPVVEVLEFLRAVSPGSAYVFPGNSPRHRVTLTDHPLWNPARSVDRIRDRTGIHFDLRDIRRTVSTKMAQLELPIDYISRVLDHTIPGEPKITHQHYVMRYAHRKQKHYALAVWARYLMGLIGRHRRAGSDSPATITVPAMPQPIVSTDDAPGGRSSRVSLPSPVSLPHANPVHPDLDDIDWLEEWEGRVSAL